MPQRALLLTLTLLLLGIWAAGAAWALSPTRAAAAQGAVDGMSGGGGAGADRPAAPGSNPRQAAVSNPEPVVPAHQDEAREIVFFGDQLFQGQFSQEAFRGFNPDYRLTVGDSISVQMWGAFEFAQALTVDAQGNIFLPEVGPVRVLGVQNQKLNKVIKEQVQKVFQSNVHVYANLEAAQPVKVFVTGFVEKPGLYNGLSSDSVLSYLDKAGGISPGRGSFLNVRIQRGMETRQRINLYDFLLEGKLTRIQLQEGDTIVVDPMQQAIKFDGLVENPHRIEFPYGPIDLAHALKLAGVLPEATHVRVVRNQGTTRNVEYYPLSEAPKVLLNNGDEVEVTADKKPGTITVRVEGEHDSAQEYVLPYGSRLADVLDRVDFNKRSDTDAIQLFRRSIRERQKTSLNQSLQSLESSVLTARSATSDEARLRSQEADLILQWIDRAKGIEPMGQVVISEVESARDILLENGDVVRIPARDGLIMISGEVMFPNAVVYRDDYRLEDYIDAVGGYTQKAAGNHVIVRHRDGTITRAREATWSDRMVAEVRSGDELLVLPKIDTKNLQITKDMTQVLYQIAVSAAVVVGL